jgi:hypothetical protein
MTLNVNSPADSDLLSTLAARDREERVAINALETAISELGLSATVTRLALVPGATSIVVGSGGLSSLRLEMVFLTGAGLANIAQITGGTEGQIKIFVLLDANVAFVRNPTYIALNQPAAIPTFGNYAGDVIAMVNVNGAPGSFINGYWKELWRAPQAY